MSFLKNLRRKPVAIKTRRESGKKGERQTMFPPSIKTPGKR